MLTDKQTNTQTDSIENNSTLAAPVINTQGAATRDIKCDFCEMLIAYRLQCELQLSNLF